jgi:hypothetical protein
MSRPRCSDGCVELGRRVLREHSDVTARQVSAVIPDERDSFRGGLMHEISGRWPWISWPPDSPAHRFALPAVHRLVENRTAAERLAQSQELVRLLYGMNER